MQLNNLPDDILLIVLQKSLPAASGPRGISKDGLPLLSVCRSLRRLALPMVYSSVYVQCSSNILPELDTRSDSSGRPAFSEQGRVDIGSDMALVAVAGSASVVRRMVIDVYFRANPLPGLWTAIERVRMVANEWTGVRSLELNMHADLIPSAIQDAGMSEHKDDIGETCCALATVLPRVHELRLGGTKICPVVGVLCGWLAGHYTEQLLVLHCKHPICVPQGRQFKRLKDVALSGYDDPGCLIPHMSPASIEHLQLKGIPLSHSWATFDPDGNYHTIEFPRLTRLNVMYSVVQAGSSVVGGSTNGPPHNLWFPNLKDLTVTCPGSTCPLLEHAVLPCMENVTIAAGMAVYRSIASTTLSATRRLTLRVPRQSGNSPGGLADVKYILAGARGCKKRELDIGDITLPVLPADIACADLTRLVVQAPTSVDTMLEFICTLHSLECLTVSSLTMEDIWSDISVPRNGRQGPVTPLDTKLSRLAISTLHRQYLPKLAISVVKYLLLKIPSLAIFYAAQIPREPVQKFVSTYSRWYLHLSNIDLKLYQTGDNARYGA